MRAKSEADIRRLPPQKRRKRGVRMGNAPLISYDAKTLLIQGAAIVSGPEGCLPSAALMHNVPSWSKREGASTAAVGIHESGASPDSASISRRVR